MIIAAAVCPHPPMLVPEVAQGAAADLDELRQACDDAVQELIASDPQHIAVLGDGPPDTYWDHHAGGTLKAYGVDVHAGGATDELPLGLAIGAWLLDRKGWTGSRAYATGEVDPRGRTALLVMADGTAKRSTEAPGFSDDRAGDFDRLVSDALAGGDAPTLAGLDEELAAELWSGGARPLRLLGNIVANALGPNQKDASVAARLRYNEAPFGVGYWVANWSLSR
ncbi:MAG: class III extradiol dioxygenase subunit B-like domain-containing protein [Aeromicrobium sp.]